jgi:hypothetical protein
VIGVFCSFCGAPSTAPDSMCRACGRAAAADPAGIGQGGERVWGLDGYDESKVTLVD